VVVAEDRQIITVLEIFQYSTATLTGVSIRPEELGVTDLALSPGQRGQSHVSAQGIFEAVIVRSLNLGFIAGGKTNPRRDGQSLVSSAVFKHGVWLIFL
jgi:hypothetical protein